MRAIRISAVAIYCAIAVYTFGYAAAAAERRDNACRSLHEWERTSPCLESPSASGLFAGAAWPFFWAWEAQS